MRKAVCSRQQFIGGGVATAVCNPDDGHAVAVETHLKRESGEQKNPASALIRHTCRVASTEKPRPLTYLHVPPMKRNQLLKRNRVAPHPPTPGYDKTSGSTTGLSIYPRASAFASFAAVSPHLLFDARNQTSTHASRQRVTEKRHKKRERERPVARLDRNLSQYAWMRGLPAERSGPIQQKKGTSGARSAWTSHANQLYRTSAGIILYESLQ